MFRQKISPIFLLVLIFGTTSIPVLAIGIKNEGQKLHRYMQEYQEYQEGYSNDGTPILEV